jgi:hypothetical protein
MPDGSSSAAPVITPGPSAFNSTRIHRAGANVGTKEVEAQTPTNQNANPLTISRGAVTAACRELPRTSATSCGVGSLSESIRSRCRLSSTVLRDCYDARIPLSMHADRQGLPTSGHVTLDECVGALSVSAAFAKLTSFCKADGLRRRLPPAHSCPGRHERFDRPVLLPTLRFGQHFRGDSWMIEGEAGSKFLPMLTACGTSSLIGLPPTS